MRQPFIELWRRLTGHIRALNPAQQRAAAEYWAAIRRDIPPAKRAELLRAHAFNAPQRKRFLHAR